MDPAFVAGQGRGRRADQFRLPDQPLHRPGAGAQRPVRHDAVMERSRPRQGTMSMRYLPLSDADRSAMLDVIGAGSIDELFRDVPEAARLEDGIQGLPNHASELSVERQLTVL